MVGPGFDLTSFSSVDGPVKREIRSLFVDIVNDWDKYEVGDLERKGDQLMVELHHKDKSISERHKVTVEVDHNP